MISYHMKHQYLLILSQIAVACQVEGIGLCLGHLGVGLTLPLNAAECQTLSFAAVSGDQVVFQDGIQLPCSPLEAATARDPSMNVPEVQSDISLLLVQLASSVQLSIWPC
jgi:hypothetical protein